MYNYLPSLTQTLSLLSSLHHQIWHALVATNLHRHPSTRLYHRTSHTCNQIHIVSATEGRHAQLNSFLRQAFHQLQR